MNQLAIDQLLIVKAFYGHDVEWAVDLLKQIRALPQTAYDEVWR